MSERPSTPSVRPPSAPARREVPPADVAEFIRFCHHRRPIGWPELYDEMCAVAARREFHGWGHDQLAAHGITFALPEMPRLAAWVRAIVPAAPEPLSEPLLGLAPA